MTTIPLRRTFDRVRPESNEPGDFAWIMATVNGVFIRHFAVVVPGPLFSMIPVCEAKDADCDEFRAWTWNGDEEKPTLSPSLLVSDGNSRFHCWVRNGVLEVIP